MARILAVWELGGSLGHIRRLAPLLKALAARGHDVTVAARTPAAILPELAGFKVLQAPMPPPDRARKIARPQSFAEILQADGAHSAEALRGVLAAWATLFETVQPDLLALDFAPNALFAAAGSGIPVAHIGTGFTLPPDISPLPNIRVAEGGYPDRLRLMEAEVLASVTAARADIGLPAPDSLGALYAQIEGQILATWPELDPFASLRPANSWNGPWSLMGDGQSLPWPEGAGPRVLAYLKPGAGGQAVLTRLAQLGAPTLCFVLGADIETHQPVPTMTLTPAPLNLAARLPEADIGICHGGHGTTAAMLGAGVPTLILPMQIEQMLTAMTATDRGASLWADARNGPQAVLALDNLIARQAEAAQATAPYQARKRAQSDDEALGKALATLEDLLPVR